MQQAFPLHREQFSPDNIPKQLIKSIWDKSPEKYYKNVTKIRNFDSIQWIYSLQFSSKVYGTDSSVINLMAHGNIFQDAKSFNNLQKYPSFFFIPLFGIDNRTQNHKQYDPAVLVPYRFRWADQHVHTVDGDSQPRYGSDMAKVYLNAKAPFSALLVCMIDTETQKGELMQLFIFNDKLNKNYVESKNMQAFVTKHLQGRLAWVAEMIGNKGRLPQNIIDKLNQETVEYKNVFNVDGDGKRSASVVKTAYTQKLKAVMSRAHVTESVAGGDVKVPPRTAAEPSGLGTMQNRILKETKGMIDPAIIKPVKSDTPYKLTYKGRVFTIIYPNLYPFKSFSINGFTPTQFSVRMNVADVLNQIFPVDVPNTLVYCHPSNNSHLLTQTWETIFGDKFTKSNKIYFDVQLVDKGDRIFVADGFSDAFLRDNQGLWDLVMVPDCGSTKLGELPLFDFTFNSNNRGKDAKKALPIIKTLLGLLKLNGKLWLTKTVTIELARLLPGYLGFQFKVEYLKHKNVGWYEMTDIAVLDDPALFSGIIITRIF